MTHTRSSCVPPTHPRPDPAHPQAVHAAVAMAARRELALLQRVFVGWCDVCAQRARRRTQAALIARAGALRLLRATFARWRRLRDAALARDPKADAMRQWRLKLRCDARRCRGAEWEWGVWRGGRGLG